MGLLVCIKLSMCVSACWSWAWGRKQDFWTIGTVGVNVHIPVVWLQMLLPNSKVLKEEFALFSIKPGCFKSLWTIHCHNTSTTSKEVSMKSSKLRTQTHKTTNNLRLVLCSLPAVFSQILSDLQIYVKKFQSTSCKLYIAVIHVLCFLFFSW